MRYWTVEEARAYLPRVRELVETVRSSAAAAQRVRGNGRRPHVEGDPGAALAELSAGDIVLRELATGLVDFHAVGDDGVVYLLCWRLGEQDLEWWHLPEEGFAGRKRLPRRSP